MAAVRPNDLAKAEHRTAVRLLTGAQAAAEAMRQIDPDVVAVYPITPQTPIIEAYAKFVADGRVHTEMLHVESEHSAMSAAVGSALAGGRTMTATASQGLAYMIEILYIAAGLRTPVVVALGNRALSGPINIHADHSDAMLARDSGAVILFAENAQEAYDLMVMAPRIAEHPGVMLPVMVGQDGFTITHSAEPVEPLADGAVRAFVGPYDIPTPLLDTAHPVTMGAFSMPDSYFELRTEVAFANERALAVWRYVAESFQALTGRDLGPLEAYRVDGAETVFLTMGSAAGTAKDAVDALRSDGLPVGLIKLRAFRPFPAALLSASVRPGQKVAVLERALSPGSLPPLAADVRALIGGAHDVRSFVFGLGGRDLFAEDLRYVLEACRLPAAEASMTRTHYLGWGRGGLA